MSEPLLAPEDNFAVVSDKEHLRPSATFKGKTLAPYSRGTRMLYAQVCSDNDLVVYRILALIFIHSKPRGEVIKLAWDIDKFREAIVDFRETLTDDEESEAQKLVEEIIGAEQSTAVEIVPSNDGKKKESPVRRRARSHGFKQPSVQSSTSSPISSSGKRQAQS